MTEMGGSVKLERKVAVVTGGGSGIGRATCELFAAEGASVVVADVAEESGQKTVESIAAAGGTAVFVATDVTSEAQVASLIAAAEGHFGGVDIVFNNAGRVSRGSVAEISLDEVRDLFALNVVGVVLGLKYGVPALRRRGGGSIVNTASAAALIGVPNMSAYCASKGAVLQLTRAAAAEVVHDGIRVNAVCPGLVDTNFYAPDYAAGADPAEFRRAYGARVPMGRMATAEEIARAVLFLASDDGAYCTGAALPVDGGVTAV